MKPTLAQLLWAIFVGITLLVVIGRLGWLSRWRSNPNVILTPSTPEPESQATTLFVFVHGLNVHGQARDHAAQIRNALSDEAVVTVNYEAGITSNVNPDEAAAQIARELDGFFNGAKYDRVVLIGESLGALIARRAFLMGDKQQMRWSAAVARIVLLAGMNRGWEISGRRPLDMGWPRWLSIWTGTWFGRLVGIGQLACHRSRITLCCRPSGRLDESISPARRAVCGSRAIVGRHRRFRE